MKISLKTLKEYTPVKYKTTEELVESVNNQIADIKGVEVLTEKYKDILVAQIVKAAPHPEADKLGIYQLNIGKEKTVQVVAGDKALKPGDKVAYFAPGVKVPFNARPDVSDGIVKATELRGVMSHGMMASAKELDISNNHDHVLKLDTKAKAGTSFAKAYGMDDIVLDVENKALTNRPECFGYIGLAREIAGIQGLPFATPAWFDYTDPKFSKTYKKKAKLPSKTSDRLTIIHQEQELCLRYMAITFDGVEIKESPVWLQVELAKAGIRSISNVVDITNYLMVITGQPLHAFDMDKVIAQDKTANSHNAIITIRRATNSEKLQMINGKMADLDTETLVIADSEKPIAIAGVMGGLPTEVGPETKRVVLECAAFDMYSIRKTSNRIGLTSDAVTRYSKNQDPEQCEAVLYKAVELFRSLASAEVSSKVYDSYTKVRKGRKVKFSLVQANQEIGLKLTKAQAVKLLKNVELKVESDAKNADTLIVNVPSYRQDLNIPQDIYEELARLFGFTNIPFKLPTRTIEAVAKNQILELQAKVRKLLAGYGATEMLTYNFINKDVIEKAGQDLANSYHLKNAMSVDLTYLRQSLLPGGLDKVTMNLSTGYEEAAMFEINKSHIKGVLGEDKLPYEFRTVEMVFSASDRVASKKYSGSPYYQAKLYVDNLLNDLHVTGNVKYESLSGDVKLPVWAKGNLSVFEANTSATVSVEVDGKWKLVGLLGEIAGGVKKSFGLAGFTCGFELNLEVLLEVAGEKAKYHEPSKYPKAWRDLCFVVGADVEFDVIDAAVRNQLTGADIVATVDLMDIYQKDQSDKEKQMTFRLTLQSVSKPLSEGDIEGLVTKVIAAVAEVGGKLKEL